MKTKILGLALCVLTLGTIVLYPAIQANAITVETGIDRPVANSQRPVVDLVFVLDTTGSMSGLIETAKEKIWSIASTMASAQPTPEIRIGLIGYRDKGDAYVTTRVDLSADLDSVYAALMAFQAGGGGDTPESVNQALYEAVHLMSWSERDQAYQVVFLVGDAPPHMDYNEVRYPEIVAAASERGIVINTIQSGNLPTTVEPWTTIAGLGGGRFFQVEQSGDAVAFATPYDSEIAELSARLDRTRLYYGPEEEQKRMRDKVAAAGEIAVTASVASQARRGVFNAAAAGRDNLIGDNELVEAVASGDVALADIEPEALPEAMKPMAPEEQVAYVRQLAKERAEYTHRIQKLAEDRDEFLSRKVEEAGGMKDSLDVQIFEAVREQGEKAGFEYKDGPAY
jgi:Mg-chelatase subunit ChlD